MKFTPDGIPHDIGGVYVRIVPGRKAPGDMRLEIKVGRPGGVVHGNTLTTAGRYEPNEWVPVKMSLVAYMVEFFYQNENLLYPPEQGFKGGEKFVEFLLDAIQDGYEVASAELEREKAARG